jgi:hypothetical protein
LIANNRGATSPDVAAMPGRRAARGSLHEQPRESKLGRRSALGVGDLGQRTHELGIVFEAFRLGSLPWFDTSRRRFDTFGRRSRFGRKEARVVDFGDEVRGNCVLSPVGSKRRASACCEPDNMSALRHDDVGTLNLPASRGCHASILPPRDVATFARQRIQTRFQQVQELRERARMRHGDTATAWASRAG